MQAKAFPARQGWAWLQAGFRLWRSAPLPLTSSAMTMLMCLLLPLMLTSFGPLLTVLLIFPLQVGMFLLCSARAEGRIPHLKLLFACFTKTRFPALLLLTGVWLGGILLCSLIALAITGFDLHAAANIAAKGGDVPAAMQSQLTKFALWIALFFIPFNMATFFAAPLIALRKLPLFKALFFSFVACWRNLAAIFVMLVVFCILGDVLPNLFLAFIGGLSAPIAGMLSGFMLMVLVPVLCAAYFSCARDIFGDWPTP